MRDMTTYTIYASGEEAKKKKIFKDVLKGMEANYKLDYLVRFFDEKAQEYFSVSVDEDERFYNHVKEFQNDDILYDLSYQENLYSVLQIVWVVKTLKALHDRGYDFKITNISSDYYGWSMKFTFDFSNLTKEQIKIIIMNAFQDNQLNHLNVTY